MHPRIAQKKRPAKKTLDSKTPPKPKTQIAADSENPPNSNPLTATKLESDQNTRKIVLADAATVSSSLETAKKSKSSVIDEKTVINVAVETGIVQKKKEIVMETEEEENNGEGEEEEEEAEEYEEEEEEEIEEIHEGPERVNNRRKQKEYEVFVGGLDRDAAEEDLERAFKEVGDVVEVRLVKKAHSQKNKGFAFVRFATVEQAKRAATEIKFVKVKGKTCGILRNNDNETLHLRNICTTWTKDKLVDKLKAFELENLEEVHLIDDSNNKGKNRGYAFLDFSTHMDAVAAYTKLQKRDIFFGTNVRAEVAFSKSAVDPDEEVMAQVKSIFLDGLPATWDETHVHEQFKKYGEIESVQLARNMPTAKRKDFGFICFTTREAALACIDDVNKKGIGEGTEKVLLKATLKRPLPKRAQPMTGGWGGYTGKGRGERGLQPHGIGHSYASRSSKTREVLGRDRVGRFSGLGQYAVKGDKLRTAYTPVGRYGDRLKRESVRTEPVVAHSSRRDPYLESSSRGRHVYQEYSTSYSRVPSRRLYDEDSYGSQYEYYDDSPVATYDYPAYSGLKRSYAYIDDDLVVSSSLKRRAGMGSSSEMDSYARRVSSDDGYSQVLLDDYYEYDRMEYPSRRYGSRYVSGSGASKSYY